MDNRFLRTLAAALLLGTAALSVSFAQETQPSAQTVATGGLFGAQPRPPQMVLTDVDFHGTPLEDVLKQMRQINPDFVYMLTREPGTPPDFPTVTLKAKQVGYEQLLRLVEAANRTESIRVWDNKPSFTQETREYVSVQRVQGPVEAFAIHVTAPEPSPALARVVRTYLLPLPYEMPLYAKISRSLEVDKAMQAILDKHLPEVRFDGQPLDGVIDALRDTSGANLVVNWQALGQAAYDRKIPVQVRLHDVAFIKVLQTILDSVSLDPTNPLSVTIDGNVITITTSDRTQSSPASLASALSLIQTALSVLPHTPLGEPADPADLKVHEETRTLIVIGTLQQQQTVEQVLRTLRGEQPARPDPAATQPKH